MPKGATAGSTASKLGPGSAAASASKRYTPPTPASLKGPSRLWVPVLMFTMLAIGSLIIILDYTGVLGSVNNTKLVIGLLFILVGIITATQYR